MGSEVDCKVGIIQFEPNLSNNSILMLTFYSLSVKEAEMMISFIPKERGQGLVEYALLLVMITLVVIIVLLLLGPIIGNVFTKIDSFMVNH